MFYTINNKQLWIFISFITLIIFVRKRLIFDLHTNLENFTILREDINPT